jgi:hypothetical protein
MPAPEVNPPIDGFDETSTENSGKGSAVTNVHT